MSEVYKTNLRLPAKLADQIKILATINDRSINAQIESMLRSQVVVDAVRQAEAIDKHLESVQRGVDALKGTVRMAEFDAAIEQDLLEEHVDEAAQGGNL